MENSIISAQLITNFLDIPQGEILSVREFWYGTSTHYQVVDGKYSGRIIPPGNVFFIEDYKKYNEKEWNDMENHYMKALDDKDDRLVTSGKLIVNLQEQNKLKDKEIEKLNFCINILAGALQKTCEVIHKLKSSEKAQ